MSVDVNALQDAILNQTTLTNQTVGILITAQFTLFFGYFGALYLFLRRMPLYIRAFAFVFYLLSNTFLTFGEWAIFQVQVRAYEWRADMIYKGVLPDYFTEASIEPYANITALTQVWYFTMVIGSVAFLLYMSFFFPWSILRQKEAPEEPTLYDPRLRAHPAR